MKKEVIKYYSHYTISWYVLGFRFLRAQREKYTVLKSWQKTFAVVPYSLTHNKYWNCVLWLHNGPTALLVTLPMNKRVALDSNVEPYHFCGVFLSLNSKWIYTLFNIYTGGAQCIWLTSINVHHFVSANAIKIKLTLTGCLELNWVVSQTRCEQSRAFVSW